MRLDVIDDTRSRDARRIFSQAHLAERLQLQLMATPL
jgi:hypothetical protein